MNDHLDPDHWCNGGEYSRLTPEAAAFAAMEEELKTMRLKLKQAIELAEAAAKGSPYKQTPHFWARISELKK
jgi:hypothetical protein